MAIPSSIRNNPRFKDLTGKTFNRLTVIHFDGRHGIHKTIMWLCRCECGKTCRVNRGNLVRNKVRSCGCLLREAIRAHIDKTGPGHRRKHGMIDARVYNIWKAMIQRCTNHNHGSYRHYGGRGITVCERWRDFRNFFADMGEPTTPKHEIDRRDNNGNYEPSNCEWVTRQEQCMNTRRSAKWTIGGKTMSKSEWCGLFGKKLAIVEWRIRQGWPTIDALRLPLIPRGANAPKWVNGQRVRRTMAEKLEMASR